MHNYKFDDETTKKVIASYESKKSQGNIDKLVKDVIKAKNVFDSADIPEYVSPNFEKMADVNKTSEEIKSEAEESLKEYKNSTLSDIENSFTNKASEIEFKKEQLKDSNENSKQNISKYYEDAKTDAGNNALKRGLSRSSIVINQMDAFDKAEVQAYISLDQELSDNINALDFELNTLNLQKKQALESFDIAYAVKLSDKINKLNEELLEEQNKVLKYNNEIAEKEKEYLDKYNELVSDIQNNNIDKDAKVFELETKYGKQAVENFRKNKLYEVLDNYFNGYSASDVAEIIRDNASLRDALGDDLQEILNRYN